MATLVKEELGPYWAGARLVHLNERCTLLLNEVEKVNGVQSAFVCDNHGRVVGALVGGPADVANYAVKVKRVTDRMGQAIAECFAAMETRHKCKDLEFYFDQKVLLARDLGNAFIAVILAAGATLSMLRMTLNVAGLEFASDAELQGSLKQAAASRNVSLSPDAMDALAWQLAQKAGVVKTQ